MHLFLILPLKTGFLEEHFRRSKWSSYYGTCNSWCRARDRLVASDRWGWLKKQKSREGKGRDSRGLGGQCGGGSGPTGLSSGPGKAPSWAARGGGAGCDHGPWEQQPGGQPSAVCGAGARSRRLRAQAGATARWGRLCPRTAPGGRCDAQAAGACAAPGDAAGRARGRGGGRARRAAEDGEGVQAAAMLRWETRLSARTGLVAPQAYSLCRWDPPPAASRPQAAQQPAAPDEGGSRRRGNCSSGPPALFGSGVPSPTPRSASARDLRAGSPLIRPERARRPLPSARPLRGGFAGGRAAPPLRLPSPSPSPPGG